MIMKLKYPIHPFYLHLLTAVLGKTGSTLGTQQETQLSPCLHGAYVLV